MVFQIELSSSFYSLFELWDENQDGFVDFSELTHTLAIITNGDRRDKLNLIFKCYDLDHDGKLNLYTGLNVSNQFFFFFLMLVFIFYFYQLFN